MHCLLRRVWLNVSGGGGGGGGIMETIPSSHKRYCDRIRKKSKIWNAQVENVIYRPQGKFAHVTIV